MKKIYSSLILLIAVLITLTSCGTPAKVTITVAAVESATTLLGRLGESFKIQDGEVETEIKTVDSDKALEELSEGKYKIAIIDRELTESELSEGFTSIPFTGKEANSDGFLIIVTKSDNTLSDKENEFSTYLLSDKAKTITESTGFIPA